MFSIVDSMLSTDFVVRSKVWKASLYAIQAEIYICVGKKHLNFCNARWAKLEHGTSPKTKFILWSNALKYWLRWEQDFGQVVCTVVTVAR